MDLRARCAIVATSIALAGCGGSESGGAGDTERPLRQERLSPAEARYVEQLDALCREGDEIAARVKGEVDGLKRRLLPKAEMSERVVALLDESYVESDAIRDRIRALEPPSRKERFHQRYNELSDRLVALNKSGRDSIARGARGGDLLPLRRRANRVIRQRGALVADHGGFRYCG